MAPRQSSRPGPSRRPSKPAVETDAVLGSTQDPSVRFSSPEEMLEALPARYSPSRLSDFEQCPKMFYYKTLLKMRSPATLDTARGTLAHYALEKVFDLPRGERTAEAAKTFVRPHWDEISVDADYAKVLALGPETVEQLLVSAETMVDGYFLIEDPNRFDPEGREMHVEAQLGSVNVHGFIDRLDRVDRPDGQVHWYISDYKSGKVPQDRFMAKAFFAMNVYAALLHASSGVLARELRLLYIKNGDRNDVRRQPVSIQSVQLATAKVSAIHKSIVSSARSGDFATKKSVLCNWCSFQSICPEWNKELAGVPLELPSGPARR